MPSVLKRKDQRVICFFNQHGFNGVLLHILRLHQPIAIETVIDLEQAVLERLKPCLNTEPFARSTHYAGAFGHSIQSKHKRSKPVHVYDKHGTLLYIFKSKQDAFKRMRLHHSGLTQCMTFNKPCLNSFVFGA